LNKTKADGVNFTTAMKNSTKWTAGVIFDKGKCYLDEEVLKLASDAKEKKQNKFWEQVESSVSVYNKMKKGYELSIKKWKNTYLTNSTIYQFEFFPHSVSGKGGRTTKKCLQKEPNCCFDGTIQNIERIYS